MFKECVRGLEKLVENDIEQGSVILVTGTPGTLKSGFVHNLLSNYLLGRDEFGVYATLEEPAESHLKNVGNLGLVKPDNLQIFDYSDIHREWRGEETGLNMVGVTEEIIKFYKTDQSNKFTVFALDSLNAMQALTHSTNPRRDSYYLFNTLRESGVTSFVILETNEMHAPSHDYFLADGVINLGIIETPEEVRRYIQIKKLRMTRHSMSKHQLTVGKDGLSVLGPVYG